MGMINFTQVKVKLSSKCIELIEHAVDKKNIELAYQKVVSNKGSAGVDNVTINELKDYLWKNWAKVKEELLKGVYRPQAARFLKIPKPPNGGVRILGIPAVIDRHIQQTFHLQSLPLNFLITAGFRAGNSATRQSFRQRSFIWKEEGG